MSIVQHDYIAFDGVHRVASGALPDVAVAARRHLDTQPDATLVIFDCENSAVVEIDLRGSVSDVLQRLPASALAPEDAPPLETEDIAPRRPGRPRLGVVAREVTLLPRHWEWLAQQSGGASVAIRKLVEAARHSSEAHDRTRTAQETTYRFLRVVAGNLPDYENVIRALYASDTAEFNRLIDAWPADIRNHGRILAAAAWRGRPDADADS